MNLDLDFRDPLAWWVNGFNKNLRLPDHHDLDPVDIPNYLPFVAIWARQPGEPLRCILAGESFREYYQRSIRGELLSDVLPERVREKILAQYDAALSAPCIFLSVGTIYYGAERYWINGFRLILPTVDPETGQERFYAFAVRKRFAEKRDFPAIEPVETSCEISFGEHQDVDRIARILSPDDSPPDVLNYARRPDE
jgi:hypothetical protein